MDQITTIRETCGRHSDEVRRPAPSARSLALAALPGNQNPGAVFGDQQASWRETMRRVFLLMLAFLFTGRGLTLGAETWAEKLGYPADQRVLILYANYLGSAYEFNRPGQEFLQEGIVQAAGMMVPCPWFDEMAAWCRKHPGHDIGICLTLNSPSAMYRWRPLGPAEQTSSLVDADGYLWRSELQVALQVDLEQAEREIQRQIEKARSAGVRPTHLTPFMGSLLARPDLLELYLRTAQRYWIPAVMVDLTPTNIELLRREGFPLTQEMIRLIRDYPLPKLDALHFIPPAATYEEKRDRFYELVRSLPPGLTQIIAAPADQTAAIKLMTTKWQDRVWERQLLADPEVREFLEKEGLMLTNWKEIMQRFETGQQPESSDETSPVDDAVLPLKSAPATGSGVG
jgi:hypothetical protein